MSAKGPRDAAPSRRARAKGDYEVGYRKPPRAHQFNPGRSGNPRGRPQGAKNEATILHNLLHRKIDIREGGRTRKITVLEAILLRFTEEALKGNTKTAAFLFNRYAAAQGGETEAADISQDDREVLEAFAKRFEAQFAGGTKKP